MNNESMAMFFAKKRVFDTFFRYYLSFNEENPSHVNLIYNCESSKEKAKQLKWAR